MGVFSKFNRFREAGEQANVNNVAAFGEPERSLFTSTKVLTLRSPCTIARSCSTRRETALQRSGKRF